MDLKLDGIVSSYTSGIGTIYCSNYKESYYFFKSDILENYRNKLKVNDLVKFELKSADKIKGRNRSKAFRISVINNEEDKIDLTAKKEVLHNYNKRFLDENVMDHQQIIKHLPENYIDDFKTFITKDFYILTDNSAEINDLVRMVVRDNIITDIEKEFIIEKIDELKLNKNFVDDLKKYLFSNNPFFDNILSLIFKDDQVKANELKFLQEKSREYEFSKSFTNKRFWQFYFKFNFESLIHDENIIKIIKLWSFADNYIEGLNISLDWIILKLDIFQSTQIEDITQRAFLGLEKDIAEYAKKNDLKIDLNELFRANNNITKIENKNVDLIIDNEYSKNEIYGIFNVEPSQQKGKWNNGYCEHFGDWFIFANIGKPGYGYDGSDFDYQNYFDNDGDLNWSAINDSTLEWKSIQELRESDPYIFIRDNSTSKNRWVFKGKGKCLYTIREKPVRFKWKISRDLVSHKKVKKKSIFDDKKIYTFKSEFEENPFTAYNNFKNYLKETLKIKSTSKIKKLWEELLNS